MVLTYDEPGPAGAWTSTKAPGADALYRAVLASPRWSRVYGLGIVRDRDRCGTASPRSRHCWSPSGAAGTDFGFDQNSAPSVAQGWDLARWLVANADALGVQGVNWQGWRWGFGRWYWRRLEPSENQHNDHVHAELNNAGAASLRLVTVVALISGSRATRASSTPLSEDQEDDQVQLEKLADNNAVWAVRHDRLARRQVLSGDDLAACELAQGYNGVREVSVGALRAVPIVGTVSAEARPPYKGAGD